MGRTVEDHWEAAYFHARVNAKKTEDAFGRKFADYEQQVKSLLGQYLQIVIV
jgi:hypothetical protein